MYSKKRQVYVELEETGLCTVRRDRFEIQVYGQLKEKGLYTVKRDRFMDS